MYTCEYMCVCVCKSASVCVCVKPLPSVNWSVDFVTLMSVD